MRKCAALLMVLLIVAGAAFAQIPDGFSVGGWGRADFVPFQGVFPDGGDAKYYTGTGSGWGAGYTGLNFQFNAVDGRIGGQFELGTNGNVEPTVGDNLHIWVKPFGSDILYLKVGKFRDGRFRGPGTDNPFQLFIGGPGKNGDAVFQRFAPDGGALFISQPVAGLSIYAQLNPGATINGIGPALNPGAEANDVYKSIQTGIAYNISGIGLARAQYVGNIGGIEGTVISSTTFTGITPNDARIEAAFNLTAVPGLNLDLGIKLPLPVEKDTGLGFDVTYQGNFQANVAGSYTSGDFGLTYGLYAGFGGSLATDISGDKRSDLRPTFNIILTPSFYVAAIDATLGLDAGFKVVGDGDVTLDGGALVNGEESTTFGFGAWVSRNLGKGSIKTGLAYQFPTYGDNGTTGKTAYLSVPVILEISF
ncbi:MAG: hypothetical protein LBQ46_07490 [Treponema sp.]|nr:hypothetical protein [Treponema sp.]